MSRSQSPHRPATAGIVVIGDEIIKGQVQDSNTQYMCSRLHSLGIAVGAIVTLPDDVNVVSKYIQSFADTYDYVLTSGGIGPTHDDLTYESVAMACHDELSNSTELEKVLMGHFGEKYSEAHRKLATIPRSAKLIFNENGFPVVSVRNIYVLPGVPKFCKLAFDIVEQSVLQLCQKFYMKELYLRCDELSIAQSLTQVCKRYEGKVTVGSYPEWNNSYYRVKITMEGTDTEQVDVCRRDMIQTFPDNSLVNYDSNPLEDPVEKIEIFKTSSTDGWEMAPRIDSALLIDSALETLRNAFKKYGADKISLGFNGGKDCTVLLHLWYTVLKEQSRPPSSINALYIRSRTPFPEVENFIEQSVTRYAMSLLRYNGTIKEQLTQLKSEHPRIEAVIMGTRYSDPDGAALKPLAPTDPGWPEFLRVNPILDWKYQNIWTFLRGLSVPYCSLYDVGYTSLGSMENTHPNPALRYTDNNSVVHYNPAYLLQHDVQERAGRTPRIHPTNSLSQSH